MSQSAMAEKLGISRNAYRNIEAGETRLISEMLDRIAAIFGTTAEEILLGYTPFPESSQKVQDIQKEYSSREAGIVSRYEDEIRRLRQEIESLRNLTEAQQETIRTKNEIIGLLRKVDSEDQIR